VLVSIVLVVSLFLTAYGTGPSATLRTVALTGNLPASGRPTPQIVAVKGALRLQLPIYQRRVTAIGFHAAGGGALSLAPVGRQGNEGMLLRTVHRIFGGGSSGPTWYELGGDGVPNSALDVGAATGTDVYSPVDGTVVGVTPYVISGHTYGQRIDVQPQTAPSFVVSLTQLRADHAISVGSTVVAGVSKVGNIVDLSDVERQALARFTQDAGNHVSVQVKPAATLSNV
jgi:hypothetical protein